MGLIGRIARHGAAALHALRVLGHGGQTVRKLQTQQAGDRHYDKQSFPHTLIDATKLDARVNERIQEICPSNLAINSGVQTRV